MASAAEKVHPAASQPCPPEVVDPLPGGEKPLLLLIDGHSLAFRSFYAFSKGGEGGLSTKDGVPTSVTYGFLKALLDHCRGLTPQGLVVAFDTAEPDLPPSGRRGLQGPPGRSAGTLLRRPGQPAADPARQPRYPPVHGPRLRGRRRARDPGQPRRRRRLAGAHPLRRPRPVPAGGRPAGHCRALHGRRTLCEDFRPAGGAPRGRDRQAGRHAGGGRRPQGSHGRQQRQHSWRQRRGPQDGHQPAGRF